MMKLNNDDEELEAVPSDMFGSPSPVSAFISGAFKGVSSRVEGVSSRVSLRAKDMLASVGDDHGSPLPAGSLGGSAGFRNGSISLFNNNSSASGGLNGISDKAPAPTPDETEVSRLVSSLSATTQLAGKVVAMNKLSSVLGEGAGKPSQSVLRSVAVPLVGLLREAEFFDPFFANACITCVQKLLEAQGTAFAAELVEAGAAQALIPLLDPRFELIRIEGLACLETLVEAERARVCAQVVGVPRGMQALVDLLDDRWDEVRHQTVSVLAAFLTEKGGVPAPVDLQNFVAFQDGFEKLFKAADEEASGDVSLRALAALSGALTNNPLSRKLFLAGGHLSRLPALLAVLKPGDISERPLVQPQQTAASTRRRWGWGGGRDKAREVDRAEVNGSDVGQAPAGPSSSSQRQAGGREKDGGSGQVPVSRIRAALSLASALVGCRDTRVTGPLAGEKRGLLAESCRGPATAVEDPSAFAEVDEIRAAMGSQEGLLEAVCELAMASPRAPVGGGSTWWEYGLPWDCQRSAMEVLTMLIVRHSGNQSRFARCQIRGAPMSVTVHGQKHLVSADPRNVVDVLLELWIAAASVIDGEAGKTKAGLAGTATGDDASVTAEVAMLDRALDAFLAGNTRWCEDVLAEVSTKHASVAKLVCSSITSTGGDSAAKTLSSNSSSDNGPSTSCSSSSSSSSRERNSEQIGDDVAGAAAMSNVMKTGLLCVRASSSESSASATTGARGNGGGGGEVESEDDDPLAAALQLRLFRRVLQAGGAGARALAANIGVPVEASRKRRGEVGGSQELRSSRQEGLSTGGLEDTNERGRGLDDGERGGEELDRAGKEGAGRVRCSPPLTPALEVAMRLLVDGYKCAVMFQTGVWDAGGEEYRAPPSDLTHYLISLGELVVTWLSPHGVGPVLSRRLLASGSSWALLRVVGRASRPRLAVDTPRNRSPEMGAYYEEDSNAAAAAAAATSSDASRVPEDPSFAYLHALVAVAVGSLVSSGSNLASGTLAAGIEKHVGLFEFCRLLDAASDWVSFAWEAKALAVPRMSVAEEMKSANSVPAFWALADDAIFSTRMVLIVQAAHSTIIERIVNGSESQASRRNNAAHGGTGEVTLPVAPTQEGDAGSVDNGSGHDGGVEIGNQQAFEALLRRQQARIEELERRFLPPAAVAVVAAAAAAATNVSGGRGRHTMTI